MTISRDTDQTMTTALPPLRAREEIARARVAIPDLLKRADEILCDTANRGNTGPHNLISDMAACLNAVILSSTAGQEWRDISTIPEEFKDGREVLLWWPEHKLDDDGNLTDEVVGGTRVIGNYMGSWQEFGGLEGRGAWFGDDSEPGHAPTMWAPLPAPPVAEPIVAEQRPEE